MSVARPRRGASRSWAGVALAPLLPGLVQHWKARLQGRRGASPLQPYRDLRRLWGKSAVDVGGSRRRLPRSRPRSPPRASPRAVLLVPVGGRAPELGRRARRARARRAAGARALRASPPRPGTPANGFALMGASRDLTLAVFVEALLVLALPSRRSSRAPPTSSG